MFIKDSSWQDKQSILHTPVTFYGECMKRCTGFAPNFGNKRTGYDIMTMHCLPSPGNFITKNVNVVPHSSFLPDFNPATFLFPQLKLKLKGCHFDTTDVVEAEGQAVLNTPTKDNFQDAFKNGTSTGNGAYERKGEGVSVPRQRNYGFLCVHMCQSALNCPVCYFNY
jgi:flavin reductase (DIM6/NTAB) family NADH-FMN oxidoreductase RutF